MKSMRIKKDSFVTGAACGAAVILVLLPMILGLYGNSDNGRKGTESVKDAPAICYSESYWQGPFDEIWTSNYYLTEDVPKKDDVPTTGWTDAEGTEYVCDRVDGPEDTDFGPCWIAVFRPID